MSRCDRKGNEMNSKGAMQELLNGKKIRRKAWASEFYIYLSKNGVILDGNNNKDEAVFCNESIWELFAEQPKVSYANGRVSMEMSPEQATLVAFLVGCCSCGYENGLYQAIDKALFKGKNIADAVSIEIDFDNGLVNKAIERVVKENFTTT